MKPNSSFPSESINARLASYLDKQKETIISEWLKKVRGDPAILATDALSTDALKNHLPEIFDDMTASLRRYGSETVAEQTVKDAEDHGATRMRQGYELTEMLRELKHLRTILIYHLRVFEDLNPDDGMVARLFVSTTLHGFLDEMAIDASEEFLWSKMTFEDQIHGGRTRW